MCLAACYWAKIDKIFYGCTKEDSKAIGFNGAMIYEELKLKAEDRSLETTNILHEEALTVFDTWKNKFIESK